MNDGLGGRRPPEKNCRDGLGFLHTQMGTARFRALSAFRSKPLTRNTFLMVFCVCLRSRDEGVLSATTAHIDTRRTE